MNVTILADQVLIDGRDLLKLKESARFLACFHKPSRLRDIPLHPGGTRVAMVWDGLGLVAYEDRPQGLMSHLHPAFSPKDTPEQPSQTGKSVIEVNGGIVTAETTERTLPRNGQTPISVDSARHFFYQADLYSISFIFGRKANPQGRGAVVGSLHCFPFSWR